MHIVMQAADVVISRAGASTLCELTALGKASVLVPSPYVTDNHHEHNARAMERGGGARVILEQEFTPQTLNETIKAITGQPQTLTRMKQNAAAMGHIDATETLYQEVLRLIAEK
jgi:UDP-N-acetylglucosamine--N-acetylmuramyl-(pentapeptide) pyrophosphoryl-undecaprenol N-acetylglucosamine transferase